MRSKKILVTAILSAILSACGGSSESTPPAEVDTLTPPPTLATVSGKVIDGYVSGAIVWLDINGNGKFDQENEPSAVSTAAGDYTLELTDEQRECVAYSTTYVDVPVGATDEDLGEVLEAYQMSIAPSLAPLSEDELLNVTPLSSEIWGQLRSKLQGSGQGKGKLSCSDIKADIALRQSIANDLNSIISTLVSHYNISAERISADYIAKGDSETYDIAQSIVKGLKAAYKQQSTLRETYPDAEIRVVVYQSKDKDTEYGFTGAWYRDQLIYLDGEDFIEFSKLKDTGSLDQVDLVLSKLHEVGMAWGDQNLKGKLSIREDIYINADGSYRCGNIERISFEQDSVHYELANINPTKNVPTLEQCSNNNLDLPDERSFSLRFNDAEQSNTTYTTTLYFRTDEPQFLELSNWINVNDKSAELEAAELITHFNTIDFVFENQVQEATAYWYKRMKTAEYVIDLDHLGQWKKTIEQADGTNIYQCSVDGLTWNDCD